MDDRPDDPFRGPSIPEIRDVIVGELAERGEWVVANVVTSMSWPVKAQKVTYRGAVVWILPLMRRFYPAVVMKRPEGMSRQDCERHLMRFLSILSWVEKHGARVEYFTGGSVPQPMGWEKERGFVICEEFDTSYFPEPASEKALLALALMREGRGLNHPGYAFLSFYRVLEVALPTRRQRDAWVKTRLQGSLRDHVGNTALEELRKRGVENIGDHLYQSNRCAVAHAAEEPVIDPDNPEDFRRLSSELAIISSLAALAIEELLGVETNQTVWEKHYYELAGFKHVFGAEIVDQVKKGEQVPDGHMVEFPELSVQLRKHEPYKPLERMRPFGLRQIGTTIHIGLKSLSERARFLCILDFEQERLHFNIHTDLTINRDDGSPEYAEEMAELVRFQVDYIGNGQLHIYETDTGALVSRKDAFIPTNYFADHDSARAEIVYYKNLAQQRWEFNQRYGEEMQRQLSTRYDIRITLGDKV